MAFLAWQSVYPEQQYRVTIQVVPNLLLTSKQKLHFIMRSMYRVTHHVV